MPINEAATIFTRVWRWTERLLNPGDALTRADLDISADDLAAGILAAYKAARRKAIPFADLPVVGNPFEQIVTENADSSYSLREWRVTGWVELMRMQPSGAVTYGTAALDISGQITAASDAATRKPIPVAALPASANPFQQVVTDNGNDTWSLREWRGSGWVEIARQNAAGDITAGSDIYTVA